MATHKGINPNSQLKFIMMTNLKNELAISAQLNWEPSIINIKPDRGIPVFSSKYKF